MKKKARLQTIVYEGLGFPIKLINVPTKEIFGEIVLDINLNKFQRDVLNAMVYKNSSMNGAEIRFIRKYFEMTTTSFGKAFGVTHAAVLKWESNRSRLPPTTELCLRLFILDKLNAKNAEFGKLYHLISVETLSDQSMCNLLFEFDAAHLRATA